jgi:hypothetical protein
MVGVIVVGIVEVVTGGEGKEGVVGVVVVIEVGVGVVVVGDPKTRQYTP